MQRLKWRDFGRVVAGTGILLAGPVVFPAVAQGTAPQQGKPAVVSAEPPKVEPISVKRVPLMTHAPRLADFAGMHPTGDIKSQMVEITDFVQSSPDDGKSATEKTDVWMGRTNAVLYVVFVCFDHDVRSLRNHLARRENIQTDDNVSILLDTFQDRRRGVLFSVNAAGVQADAAWTEGNGSDYSYDQVWDSDGRVTPQGWMALMAIPFRSLRFPATGADWGVVLMRSLPRNSESDNWPHISTRITGTLSQEGTLQGIQGVTGSHNAQLNPYALGQNERRLQNLDPNNPYFSKRELEGTAGGEAKVILKDRIVLDATVNPDFSDIESDQPQFTVNQRYPVYFPELRPFFLENANYFSTPITLLYTRNIVHPEFGIRATGKVGNTNVGLLAIDDRQPGETFPRGDPDAGKRAFFGIGRVSQDIGKGSNIGVMYTDYEFAGSWNRIGGVDFTARFNDAWSAYGQMVESSTKHLDRTYAAGPGSQLQVVRNGHAFNMQNTYSDNSTGFQSQVGFIQTTDYRNDQNHATYRWYTKHNKVLQSFGLEQNQNIAYDHQGNRIYHYSQYDPFVLLARNTTLAPIGGQNSDTVGPQNGYAVPSSINFTENYAGFVARSAPFRQLNFNIVFIRGGNVNYNPLPGRAPFLLNQQNLQALVTIQPFRSLTVDNTYLLDRNHNAHTNADVYENQTLRTKINYQFTRALSARVIVEYDSVLVNPTETSLVRTKQVSTEALLTWLPHPGTAIYLGYNNDLQNFDRTLCQRGPGGTCNPMGPILPRSNNYLNDGKQLFLKASYLLRF
ncbi:MAG TPA: carbohydrate binding family 9 domain-containing protein [Acidobacteriaceae bacterium]